MHPSHPYPDTAIIPQQDIDRILGSLRTLWLSDPTFYLRLVSISMFNGMVSVTFSCDGSHCMPHSEFLQKGTSFWF